MRLGLEYLLILLSCIPSHSNLSPEVKRLSQLYQEISLISGFDISPEHLVARIVHLGRTGDGNSRKAEKEERASHR